MRNAIRQALILMISISMLIVACSQDPQHLISRAKDLEAKGDRIAAILNLKNAIQQDPDNAEARYFLGRLYNREFDGVSAEKELVRALESGYVLGGRVAMEHALALRIQGHQQRLLDTVLSSEAFEPEVQATILAWRGGAQFFLRQFAEAKKSFAEASSIAPSLPDVVLLDALLRLADRDLTGAVDLTKDVVGKHPDSIAAWSMLGKLRALQGNHAEAINSYSKVLEIRPNHFDALINRSSLFIRTKEAELAQQDVDALVRSYPRSEIALYQRSAIFYMRGLYREALDSVQVARKMAPGHLPSLFLEGIIQHRLGAYQQAERLLSIYLAADPKHVSARHELAQVLIRQRQATRALETLDPLLRGDGKLVEVLETAGDAYALLGKLGEANELFTRAAQIAPNRISLTTRLAMNNFSGGNMDGAIEQLEKLAITSNHVTQSDTVLVVAHIARKEFVKAEGVVSRLESRAPKDPQTYNLKGAVFLKKGDREAAVREFEKATKLQPNFFQAVANLVRLNLDAGNLIKAKARLEAVLQADKNNLEALLTLAEIYAQSGAVDAVEATLKRAVDAHGSAIAPKARLVQLYLEKQDKARALSIAQSALASNPEHPAAMELVGAAQLANGDVHSALGTFSNLLRQQPTSEKAYFSLAQAQFAAGKTKEGEESLRRAIALGKGYTVVQFRLLDHLLALKRYDDAVLLGRALQQAEPKSAVGFVIEGEAYAAQKKFPQAIAAFQSALKIQPVEKVALKLAMVQAAFGQQQQALRDLEKFVSTHPKAADARIALGDLYLSQARYAVAIEHYEIALTVLPKHPETLNNAAWAYWMLNDADKSFELAKRAYQTAPENPIFMDTYGWMLVQQGKFKEGRVILEKALAKAPDLPELRFHHAVLLSKVGEKFRAKQEIDKLLREKPKFSEVHQAQHFQKSLSD